MASQDSDAEYDAEETLPPRSELRFKDRPQCAGIDRWNDKASYLVTDGEGRTAISARCWRRPSTDPISELSASPATLTPDVCEFSGISYRESL